MARSAQELLIVIDSSTELLRRELRQADTAVAQASTKMGRSLTHVDAAFTKLNLGAQRAASGVSQALGAMGVALGGAAVVQGVGSVLDRMQEIQRTAQGLGISIKAVQELSYTFEQFNVASEDVTEGLAQLSGQAIGALGGSKSLVDTWGQLGITVDQLRGKDPAELFRLLAHGIAQTESPTVRLATASTLLGEDLAGKLMPLLVQGAQGLDTYAQKAEKLGLIFEDKLVKGAGDTAQKLKDVKAQLTGTFTQAVVENADAFVKLADALAKVAAAGARAAGWFTDAGTWLGEATARAAGFRTMEDQLLDAVRRRDTLLKERRYRAMTGGSSEFTAQADRALLAQINEANAEVIRLQRLYETYYQARPKQTMPTSHVRASRLPPQTDATPAPAKEEAHRFDPEAGFFEALDQKRLDDMYNGVEKIKESFTELQQIGDEIGYAFSSSFEEAIVSAQSLGDVLQGLVQDIQRILLRQFVTKPLANLIGTGISHMAGTAAASAKGHVFDQQGLVPFARGGIVTGPTVFPFASGTGLMGEAGPEAVLPITRGRGGKLGVLSSGGGAPTINFSQHIDARGAEPGVEQRLAAQAARIRNEAMAGVFEAIQRGGAAYDVVRAR